MTGTDCHRRLRARGSLIWGVATLLFSVLSLPVCADVQIDGVWHADEWQDAQHVTDFRQVQPTLGGDVPDALRVEAWFKSTPQGVAAAMKARHPDSVPRTETRMQRDGHQSVDRANFMIDFDGDARSAYVFTLTQAGDIIDHALTNENQLNTDWDGEWAYAAHRDGENVVFEWLIPWTTAAMRPDEGGQRKVRILFDRVIAATGQRFAWPEALLTQPVFMSRWAERTIPSYSQRLLAVTPYVVAGYDLKARDPEFKTGADLFWKPNANHQFAATLNPDFGQVESDQLVVNFDAIETFFVDKRPFFIDNQTAFEGSQPGASLFYTRRVGGPSDDGEGASDIDAAVKANGQFGALGYAGFAATESGEAGREFYLGRLSYGDDDWNVRLTQTWTDRPALDRTAGVTGLHARVRPRPGWSIDAGIMHSDITQGDASSRDSHMGARIDVDPEGPTRHAVELVHTGAAFDPNDLGYQARNNQNYANYAFTYRQDQVDSERFASHEWTAGVQWQGNDQGVTLMRRIDAWRSSQTHDGGTWYSRLSWQFPGIDDLISRDNGLVPTQSGPSLEISREVPRQGNWSQSYSFYAFPNTRTGHSWMAGLQPRYHVSDRLSVDLGLYAWRQDGWLLWQGDRDFTEFDAKRVELYSNLNWFPADRHEFRIKLQAIAIDAEAAAGLMLGSHRNWLAGNPDPEDFSLQQLGLQLRYRYKLGHQRDLFVVYGRGGFGFDTGPGQLGDVFQDAFSLRDDDRLLIKLAYRFAPG
ncbi:hypothetical protein C7S18_18105 [Ahniella affigens]|uniref:DUF5916 domain-containing protein n=2 Tax=Ahniella affigens TaxID=2021234 RepID=A0A2P1PVW3_9GAMM|nr:hypothetical protein C7S18_18105 [Ahniella affigens]